MLNKVNETVYYRHIAEFKQAMHNNQFKDQFKLDIIREAPSNLYLNPYFVKAFTINYEGFSVEASKLGTVNFSQIVGVEPLSVNVVFREKARDEIIKFLLFNDNGYPTLTNNFNATNIGHMITSVMGGNFVNNAIHYVENALFGNVLSGLFGNSNYIPPTDGTFLLPYEWYFHLTAYSLDERWSPLQILEGDFIIEGAVEKDFSTDDANWQEVAVTFKPIQSNTIKYHGNGVADYVKGFM